MNDLTRRIRGMAAMAALWGAAWGILGASLSIVVGISDPQSIDPGEGPVKIGALLATVGTASGAFFAAILALAERRRKSAQQIPLWSGAVWGMIGSAILPSITTMNDSVLLNTVPLGALSAIGVLLMARRGARRDRSLDAPAPRLLDTNVPEFHARARTEKTAGRLR